MVSTWSMLTCYNLISCIGSAALLALIGWLDHYRGALLGLGLPDSAFDVPAAPRATTPRGEAVPLHGLDVARLVYIARVRRQLAAAFTKLAEGDLLKACSTSFLPQTACCRVVIELPVFKQLAWHGATNSQSGMLLPSRSGSPSLISRHSVCTHIAAGKA